MVEREGSEERGGRLARGWGCKCVYIVNMHIQDLYSTNNAASLTRFWKLLGAYVSRHSKQAASQQRGGRAAGSLTHDSSRSPHEPSSGAHV